MPSGPVAPRGVLQRHQHPSCCRHQQWHPQLCVGKGSPCAPHWCPWGPTCSFSCWCHAQAPSSDEVLPDGDVGGWLPCGWHSTSCRRHTQASGLAYARW